MTAMLALLGGITGVAAAPSCRTMDDCSLNGQCVASKCACFPGWAGYSCAALDLEPAPAGRAAAAFPPPSAPNTTAWGGRALFDNGTQLYHGWFAEMSGHCGMSVWEKLSVCRHATSKTLEGPYVPLDQGSIGVDCHNPSIIRAPNGSLLLFHIGGGQPFDRGAAEPPPPRPLCTNGTTPPQPPQPLRTNTDESAGPPPPAPAFWVSDGVGRPWRSGPLVPAGAGFNNPAPYIFPNGSMMVAYVLRCGAPCNNSNGIAWTDDWASGVWEPMDGRSYASQLFPPVGAGRAEDPFLWVDKLGHCHALVHDQGAHGGTPSSYGALGETSSGGHAFSRDCRSWHYSAEPAYNTTVRHADGSSTTYIKRERPHLAFDREMTPVALFTGMMAIDVHRPVPPHCTWANAHNKSVGYCDPAFTHVQKLRRGGGGGSSSSSSSTRGVLDMGEERRTVAKLGLDSRD